MAAEAKFQAVDRVLIGPKTVIISPSTWKQIETILRRQPYEAAEPILSAVEYFEIPEIGDDHDGDR